MLRSRSLTKQDYALSVLAPDKIVHYLLEVPSDASQSAVATVQGKPVPDSSGKSIAAIIDMFGATTAGLIACKLTHPASAVGHHPKLVELVNDPAMSEGEVSTLETSKTTSFGVAIFSYGLEETPY